MTISVLNWRQAQWALFLSQFQFVITTYHLGRHQRKLDALSYRLYFASKKGDATYEQECDVILKLEHLQLQAL
jgi:hypothetical protein